MATTELLADMDGYVRCPRRGEISVEWCEGCPFRVSVDHGGGQVVVVCDADGAPDRGTSPGALRDLPELWR